MKKKEIFFLILAVLVLIVLIVFFVNKERKNQEIELKEKQEEVVVQDDVEYILSLPRGTVDSLGEDFFIVELDPYGKKIKVNVTEETQFALHDSHIQLVSIPKEYETWLSKFHYIINLTDEEYVIYLYFDVKEDLGENKETGIFDTEEVTATYVSWNHYLKK
jgi:preprotein translocase subunit YajC